MNRSPDRLYDLLPAVYRLRDAERGEPLRALLEVISEQVNLVDADIGQMYDNWFIETCEDWVVPYIADLLGYQSLNNPGALDDFGSTAARARNKILTPRRDAANVISYRRRKGVLSLLELLARDAANYPAARAVEFYSLLGWTQNINFQHLNRGRTVDMRDGDALDLINSPFESSARMVDVRRASSSRTHGRYNIPAVGVFIWRLNSYSVTKTPAYCLEEESPECYTFSVLGNDTMLVNRPEPETDPTHIADELNLPTPIRRRAFERRHFKDGKVVRTEASENYYDRSLSVYLQDKNGDLKKIPRNTIVPANLSDWGKYRPKRGLVAVDPVLGRIVFPSVQRPKCGVSVSYHYAFPADIGGGEYKRTLSQPKGAKIYRVGNAKVYRAGNAPEFQTINEALTAWEKDVEEISAAVIEIADSGVYTEPLKIELKAGSSLQIRAANRCRPVIRLLDYQSSLPDSLSVNGDTGSRFTLDGLLIAGRSVQFSGPELSQIGEHASESDGNQDTKYQSDFPYEHQPTGDLCEIVIRHCTLVPGWSLHYDCEPQRKNEPSLELEYTAANVRIEHSIIGTISVEAHERANEPQSIEISDSILDATSEERIAVGSCDDGLAYARMKIARTTVIGSVKAHSVVLAENTIFNGRVTVGRKQTGCFRFCYVAPGSRTPRRFNCQPDLAEQAVEAELHAAAQVEIEAAKLRERMRVKPKFNSLRYGTPTFCQLASSCAVEIKTGADDESEMGVYHDLYQPQRAANLRTRLDEYTPADADVGIFYAS